jgi:hypothetical protein
MSSPEVLRESFFLGGLTGALEQVLTGRRR